MLASSRVRTIQPTSTVDIPIILTRGGVREAKEVRRAFRGCEMLCGGEPHGRNIARVESKTVEEA
jgi:hypothetical protein